MILDIDYFKNINDKFGHKKGDYVLIEFATIVEDFLDADHHLFRWGGEEFVIIFENYTKTKAHNIGQKLLKKIKKHDFGINTPLSFSGGVTDYNRIDDLAVTLEKADQALYRAKNEGRGKIIIS
jgi:polar amino acid transport system substrate-binding protein